MKPYMLLRADELAAERPAGTTDDVHFTEALAASVIEDVTAPGDLVLDPFAGYGTTLAVAQRLGRRAVGVELLAEHVHVARSRTSADVVHGDARRLGDLVTGPVDLVLTSPPYAIEDARVGTNLRWYLANSVYRSAAQGADRIVVSALNASTLSTTEWRANARIKKPARQPMCCVATEKGPTGDSG